MCPGSRRPRAGDQGDAGRATALVVMGDSGCGPAGAHTDRSHWSSTCLAPGRERRFSIGQAVLPELGGGLVLDRQWVIGVIVVLVGLAAVIGVVLYLDAYFS